MSVPLNSLAKTAITSTPDSDLARIMKVFARHSETLVSWGMGEAKIVGTIDHALKWEDLFGRMNIERMLAVGPLIAIDCSEVVKRYGRSVSFHKHQLLPEADAIVRDLKSEGLEYTWFTHTGFRPYSPMHLILYMPLPDAANDPKPVRSDSRLPNRFTGLSATGSLNA